MCSNCRDYEGPYDDEEIDPEEYRRKRARFWLNLLAIVMLWLLELRKMLTVIWQ